MEARRAHNPEVVGSSPASATRKEKVIPNGVAFFFSGLAKQARTDLRVMSPTSVARCGKRGERRRGAGGATLAQCSGLYFRRL